MAYYTSKYSGEEIDEAADKVNDSQVGNDALKALIDALAARVDKAPKYTYGTADLTPGVSPLEEETLYFVYE